MGPQSSRNGALIRRQLCEDAIVRKSPCGEEVRDWSYAAASQVLLTE